MEQLVQELTAYFAQHFHKVTVQDVSDDDTIGDPSEVYKYRWLCFVDDTKYSGVQIGAASVDAFEQGVRSTINNPKLVHAMMLAAVADTIKEAEARLTRMEENLRHFDVQNDLIKALVSDALVDDSISSEKQVEAITALLLSLFISGGFQILPDKDIENMVVALFGPARATLVVSHIYSMLAHDKNKGTQH